MANNIPAPVKKSCSELINRFGNRLKFIGMRNGSQIWQFRLPDTATVGLPVVMLYKDGKVTDMDGEEAAILLASLLDKD